MNESTVDIMEVLEALHVRELCKASVYMTKEKATKEHFALLAEAYAYYPDKAERISRERELLALGEKYFAEGYRIHNSHRWVDGHAHADAPSNALASRIVSSGHIATSEAVRRQWVTKS